MTIARALALSLVLLPLGVLTLSGCSDVPISAPIAADPTPSASPATDSDELPTVRVPLTCAQLADPGALSALVGATVAPAEVTAEFATRQYGQLDCAWNTGLDADPTTSPSVAISVVPGVPARYWAESLAMRAGTGETSGGFAGDSSTSCPSGPGGSGCSLTTLIGDYWLSVRLNSTSPAVTLASATPIFTAAAAAVSSAAPPADRWTPASSGGPAPESGVLDAAALGAALGATAETTICGPTAQAEEHWVAWAEIGYSWCTYGIGAPGDANTYLTVSYLPGGSWALPEAQTAPGATAIAELGDGAFASRDEQGPVVNFARGGDLVSIGWYSVGTPEPTVNEMTATALAITPLLP